MNRLDKIAELLMRAFDEHPELEKDLADLDERPTARPPLRKTKLAVESRKSKAA